MESLGKEEKEVGWRDDSVQRVGVPREKESQSTSASRGEEKNSQPTLTSVFSFNRHPEFSSNIFIWVSFSNVNCLEPRGLTKRRKKRIEKKNEKGERVTDDACPGNAVACDLVPWSSQIYKCILLFMFRC